MTVIDFIDINDDIIELSSDEETVQEDHAATQCGATLLDRQAVFVLAGEGMQDGQAAFVSAVEGSQAANESGNALVATTSPPVTEKTPLHTVESQNCGNSPTAAFPSPTSTTVKVLSSEVGDTKQDVFVLAGEGRQDGQAAFVSAVEGSQVATESGNALVATTLPSVTEKTPLRTAESQNCASSPTAPFPSPTSTTPKVLSSEVGDTKQDMFVLAGEGRQDGQAAFDLAGEGSQMATESGDALVATDSPSVTEKTPLDMADSKNCPSSPTSAPVPSPATTAPKALTSEDSDTKRTRVRHHKKYYTRTPRRSPRFEQKRECCDDPVEQPADGHKRSRLLEPAEESAAPADDAESAKALSTDSEN
uniref:Uncharacterized protein n=1 Tax=Avena sativa TaxID=4498 RepID=A0ACD5VCL5_AVESA